MATYLYYIYVFMKFCDLWECILIIPTLSSLNLKCLLIFPWKDYSTYVSAWHAVVSSYQDCGRCPWSLPRCVWGVWSRNQPVWGLHTHMVRTPCSVESLIGTLSWSHFVIDDSEGYNICCWISHWAFQWGKKFIFLWFLRIILLTLSNGK